MHCHEFMTHCCREIPVAVEVIPGVGAETCSYQMLNKGNGLRHTMNTKFMADYMGG